ncbi:MAG TPA: putative sugar O-methyltransferase [Terriglobales bacterium]|nr:putative sugar O-methyltransferase [Terriglobales bacterium]
MADFRSDPLASLAAVKKGFADRGQPANPQLVFRVREAYRAAKRDQAGAAPFYQPTGEWTTIIAEKLQLLSDDVGPLTKVLENMFRNDAVASIADRSDPKALSTWYTKVGFANAALHDYQVWRKLIGGDLTALNAPPVGNPCGYWIGDTLVMGSTFRHHYTTSRILTLLGGPGTVAEIGGGYGECGHFALQHRGVTYLDFDLPEVLLIASFWLCSVNPTATVALYGESDPQTVLADPRRYDAVLYPNYCLPTLPDMSVDVLFNTRSLSEMDVGTIREYLAHIARCTRGYFYHENSDVAFQTHGHVEIPASSFAIDGFRLLSKTISPWYAGAGRYREFLYART